MGSSPSPSAPTTYIPTPAAPTLYQSVIPKESYAQAGEYLKRINEQLNTELNKQYQQVGTPAEQGARTAGYQAQQAASYASSIPVTDRYIQQTTGVADVNAAARLAAGNVAANLQQAYQQKQANAGDIPAPIPFTMPSWASGTGGTGGSGSNNNNGSGDDDENRGRGRNRGDREWERNRNRNTGNQNERNRYLRGVSDSRRSGF